MSLPRIISFSARKMSGKTLCCTVLEKYDYVPINFADALKGLCCELLKIPIVILNEQKELSQQIILDETHYIIIANTTSISLEKVVAVINNRTFFSIRELLQFIGTNLIREFNPRWHINQLETKILTNPTTKFSVSDARFINEIDCIRMLGGETWFIIKPDNTAISNHSSETEVYWKLFPRENVYINNKSKAQVLNDWESYMKTGIRPDSTSIQPSEQFLYPTMEDSYSAGRLLGQNMPGNVYTCENLKFWNVYADKKGKCFIGIPDIIRGDKNCLKQWRRGILDSGVTIPESIHHFWISNNRILYDNN
jgi:hypothetical protein